MCFVLSSAFLHCVSSFRSMGSGTITRNTCTTRRKQFLRSFSFGLLTTTMFFIVFIQLILSYRVRFTLCFTEKLFEGGFIFDGVFLGGCRLNLFRLKSCRYYLA